MSSLFKVTPLGQNTKYNIPILSGVSFGWLDKELVFKVEMDMAEEPLLISFIAKKDSSRQHFEFSAGDIKDNKLVVHFYNPSENGLSGLTTPVGLFVVEPNILGFMFHMDILPNSDCFRISYEFYHGTFADEEGESK